jgi:DNA-binding transcriptional regulator YdaS (Cro superfamily)
MPRPKSATKTITRTYEVEIELPEDPLEAAVVYCGSATELARAVGVGPSAITNWRARGSMSYRSAKAIERATEGQVSVADLEPYLYDLPYLRGE